MYSFFVSGRGVFIIGNSLFSEYFDNQISIFKFIILITNTEEKGWVRIGKAILINFE